jgi:hypothetical protein
LQVARSSFPPRSAATILVIAQRLGSSIQIRYFLPGSLSIKPLGTTAIMLFEHAPRQQEKYAFLDK